MTIGNVNEDRLNCLKKRSDATVIADRDVAIRTGVRPKAANVGGISPRHVDKDREVFSDSLTVEGELSVSIIRKDGTREDAVVMKNIITQSGLGLISDVLCGIKTTPIVTMWIGTGGRLDAETVKAPQMGNTRLYEFYAERPVTTYREDVDGDITRGYQAISRFAATFDFTEDVHINEAGLSTGGVNNESSVMLNHRTFYDRVLYSEDFLELVWDIIFSRYATIAR